MRHRSRLLTAFILAGAAAAVVGLVGGLLKQEPAYYTPAEATPAEPGDDLLAAGVITRFGDLKNDIMLKPEWDASISAAELNAFFRDSLDDEDGSLAGLLPGRLHTPRVAVEGDRIKIAGRRGRGFWSAVVSIELRAWLVKEQVNTVAIEVCGMWAGSLPLPAQQWLEKVSEAALDSNVEVTWYRHDGHPVGLFRFYADQPRPTTQLRTVKVGDGRLTVAGWTGAGGMPAGSPRAGQP